MLEKLIEGLAILVTGIKVSVAMCIICLTRLRTEQRFSWRLLGGIPYSMTHSRSSPYGRPTLIFPTRSTSGLLCRILPKP